MKRKRNSLGKRIRPTFFVFCEGESEEAYVKFLRSKFRLPIEVCPSVTGLSINQASINKFKKSKSTHAKDKDYLMYDLDRDDVIIRLQKIKGATIILSNPCLELWYLLHYINQKTEITSSQCLKALIRHLPEYKKGEICGNLQDILNSKQEFAVKRAKALPLHLNPSSDMHILLADIESASK